jgi:hypothetical protein
MPPQFQVEKVFPQRGYLCLHRLVKRAAFTCNRCGLRKTSKLVAFRQGQMGRTYVQWLLWLSTFCSEKQGEVL